MADVVVLAAAVGVIVLAAREGRRASRPGRSTAPGSAGAPPPGPTPVAAPWTPVATVVGAAAVAGGAAPTTSTGPSRRGCRCADRGCLPGTGASGGSG